MQYALFFVICFCATVLGAISGIGGGVIIKPVLDAVSGYSSSEIGLLSGCTVLAMSLVSVYKSRKSTDVKASGDFTAPLAVGGALGGALGRFLFDVVKGLVPADGLVTLIQNSVLLALTVAIMVYMALKARLPVKHLRGMPVCLAIGLCLGILSSFLGIGGGPFNLVALTFFLGMDSKTAALNSIYIICLSQIVSLLTMVLQNKVPYVGGVVLLLIIAGVLGGAIGRRFSGKMSNKQVDFLFTGMLWFIGAVCVYNITAALIG